MKESLFFIFEPNFKHEFRFGLSTGKSFSEALFLEEHVLPRFELGLFMELNSMNNLSSHCGLVDAKIRASDKDLPVLGILF